MSTSVLRIHGQHMHEPKAVQFQNTYDDFHQHRPVNNNRRQIEKKKPLKVHSPKTRMGWQSDVARANYDNARSSTIHLDHQTVKDAPPVSIGGWHRAGAGGTRFQEIKNKMTSTQVDKLMEPARDVGYSTSSERPQPACPTEASREFYNRNQNGTYGFMDKNRRNHRAASADAPKTRCPMNETKENLERGRGQAGAVIFPTSRPNEVPKGPRLGIGGDENYNKHLGGGMMNVMNQSANKKYTEHAAAARTIKGEAAETNAQRNKGQAGELMALGGKGSTGIMQPAPRVRPEARDIASREGAGMRETFFGGGQPDPKPTARVRLGADSNLEKGKGSLTNDIYNYSSIKSDPQPGQRVKGQGEEISRSHQGVVTKNLFQKYGNLPSDMPPKPHVQPRGRGIARKSQGRAMADCVNPVRDNKKRRKKRQRRPVSAHA